MIGHFILIALGLTYLVNFGGRWLNVQPKPLAVRTRPICFDGWCHLCLGTCYTCAGAFGA